MTFPFPFPTTAVASAAAPVNMKVKVGSLSTGTGAAASNVVVTGVGFQPKALIFWWSGRTETTDALSGGNAFPGFGFAVSSTQRGACSCFIEDAQTTTDTDRASHADACITMMGQTGAIDGLMDFVSMDSDGFTLVVDDAFSFSMRVHYMALGGSDITNAFVGTFTTNSSGTTNQDITTVGFQPDCLLAIRSAQAAAPISTSASLTFGIATAASQVHMSGVTLNAGGTATGGCYVRAGEFLSIIPNAGPTGVNTRISLNSMLSNGFRLSYAENTLGGHAVHFLALKGGAYHVGDIDTRTDGNNITETGLAFQPVGVLFGSTTKAQSAADTSVADFKMSLGAADSPSSRACMAFYDRGGGTDPSQVATAIDYDSVYVNISISDTLDGEMDLVSFNSDGFTAVMDDTDPSAAFVWYLAFGPAP